MHWLSCFGIILSLAVTTSQAAPHKIKLLNLLSDSAIRSLFDVDSSLDVPEFDMASPAQVFGNRAKRSLAPMHRYQRRSTRSAELRDVDPYPKTTELAFTAFGIDFHLNLTKNPFVAPDMVVRGGVNGEQVNPVDPCFYHGTLIGTDEHNSVSVSICDGLNGLIRTPDYSYTIKQLPASVSPHFVTEYGGFPHIVYRRRARSGQRNTHEQDNVEASLSRLRRDIVNLDDIEKLTIEMVVMVDSTVVKFFDSDEDTTNDYVLDFVNELDRLLRNPSFGAYNLTTKLLAIHYFRKDDGQYEDHGKVINQTMQFKCDDGEECLGDLNLMKDVWEDVKNEYEGADHAIYLTKRKLCFDKMTGCKQSGYAPVGGMCGGRSSISVARADGLSATSEEAHELGHNLGIHHDGKDIDDCYDTMYIMSVGQSGTIGNDFTWSPCSARQLADNIRKGTMTCLNINEGRVYLNTPIPSALPGTYLDHTAQCKLIYGEQQADGDCAANTKAESSCEHIYCRQKDSNRCMGNFPPAEGTDCNTESNDMEAEYNGWCRIGECLAKGTEPEIDTGEWSDWEEGDCSVTCGRGIKSSTRSCNAADGQQYCKGSNIKYDLCNTQLCDGECSDVTAQNYRNNIGGCTNAKFFGADACTLYCGNTNKGKVPDGGRQTDDPGQWADLDICIDGKPVTIGCDVDDPVTSGLVYDNCGVCDGDNTACTYNSGKIDKEEIEVDDKTLFFIATLIKGTTDISFKETKYVQSAYFVLRKSDGTYLTNSDYTVRPAYTNTAGASPLRYITDCDTIFTHYHPSQKVEEIVAPGPIGEAIDVLYYIKKASKFENISYSYYSPEAVDHQYENKIPNDNDPTSEEDVDNNEEEPQEDNNTVDKLTTEAGQTAAEEATVEQAAEGTQGGNVPNDNDPTSEEDIDNNEEEPQEDDNTVDELTTEAGQTATEEGTGADGEATGAEGTQGGNDNSCEELSYVGGMIENQALCTAKNGKRGIDDWMYKFKRNSCVLNCYSESNPKDVQAPFNGGIEDGSWCSDDVNQPKTCKSGTCVEVGCDENNEKTFDHCGVCGGDDSTCKETRGTIQLSEDVTSIVTFPVGATRISARETDSKGQTTKLTKGYFVLETDSGVYLTGTNADGTPSEPADKSGPYYYELGCTAIQHDKVLQKSETIESDSGPLSEDVHLKYQFVAQKNERFVHYEYWLKEV